MSVSVLLPKRLEEVFQDLSPLGDLLMLIFERQQWLQTAIFGHGQQELLLGLEELTDLRSKVAQGLFDRMLTDPKVLHGDIPLSCIQGGLPCRSQWAESPVGEDGAVPGAVVLLDLMDLLSNMLTIHENLSIKLRGAL